MGAGNSLKKWNRSVKRLLSAALACMLLFSVVGATAQAANGTKNTASRAIAIVFDNSGSMYMNQNMAWCRATYAIEVFAAMMNESDVLQVYPMYEVTVNGRTYTSESPVIVSGGGDISAIRNMYTPYAQDTPIETIEDAYRGLQKTDADEKWLIVLTDGDKFFENNKELSVDETKARLEEVLTEYNRSVNVLYLGIGSQAAMPVVADNGAYQYYADKAGNSADVLSKLTDMCNMIFGRDALSSADRQIEFDVSMKKLILFVQGSDISNVTLKDSAGASVGSPTVEYSPRYSEQGAGTVRKDGAPLGFRVDTSLSGAIAVYDIELDAGTYFLDYTGSATNVSVYYEPDVDLVAGVTDENGAAVSASGDLYPGTYHINYGLVDRSGNMTSSGLLGSTSYKVTYSVNGEEQTAASDQSGQITLDLNEGDVLDGKITVSYLSGYTITKDSSELGWPSSGFHITARPAGSLTVSVSGGADSYRLSELENTSYTVRLSYNGEMLTADELTSAELSVRLEGGNADYAVEQDGDGYVLSLRYAGAAADTDCGDYTMYVSASYTDEFGVTARSVETAVPFTIGDDGYRLGLSVDSAGYYVISKLDKSEPIKVSLSLDGGPLTDGQLAEVTLAVDADGLTYVVDPLPGESAYSVRIVGDDSAQSGKYTLRFTASMQDQVGREVSADGTKRIELSTYPLWLRILVIILILLLILALVIFWLTRKILPQKITLNRARTIFTVNGETVEGTAKCSYSGGGRKSGSLQVSTPPYTGNPLVRSSFTLTLQAVSQRRIKSAGRRALVTNIAPGNVGTLVTLSVGTHTLVKSDEGDSVVWLFDGKQVPSASVSTGFEIGGKPVCTIMGETITGNDFTLSVQLQFK